MFSTQASYVRWSWADQFGISSRSTTVSPLRSIIGAQLGTAIRRSGVSSSSAVNRNRPSGLNTRAISAKTAIRSWAKNTASAQIAPSTLSASKPVAVMSPRRNRAYPGGTNSIDRSAAARIPAADQSTPTRFTFRARASHSPTPPRPQARSSNSWLGLNRSPLTNRPSVHHVVPPHACTSVGQSPPIARMAHLPQQIAPRRFPVGSVKVIHRDRAGRRHGAARERQIGVGQRVSITR